MPLYRVVVSRRAKQDIDDAFHYIGRASPSGAARWRRLLLETLLELEIDPEMWPLAPESDAFDRPIRQIIFRTRSRRANRILFIVVDNIVLVSAVRRPGQPLIEPRDLE